MQYRTVATRLRIADAVSANAVAADAVAASATSAARRRPAPVTLKTSENKTSPAAERVAEQNTHGALRLVPSGFQSGVKSSEAGSVGSAKAVAGEQLRSSPALPEACLRRAIEGH